MFLEKITSIDEYISQFDPQIQEKLNQMRDVIKKTIPDASEKISWNMPTFFTKKGDIVYFGAFKNHIGFFPTPSGVEVFKSELQDYKTSKGTIQFPYSKPIPEKIVAKITKFRYLEVENN